MNDPNPMNNPDPENDPDPETELLATRQAVQRWLLEQAAAMDEPSDLAALNLRVWATAFLRVTKEEAREIEERLRVQGETNFARRVVESAKEVFEIVPDQDTWETLGRAFAVEVLRLDEDLLPWKPGGERH